MITPASDAAFGFLAIAKPAGITSHDVIARLRHITRLRAIGHTGTLDPLATGVLVVCVGKATRLASFVEAQEKEYLAGVQLGAVSNTYDSTGIVTTSPDATPIARAEFANVLEKFTGHIQQLPPAFSALKIKGERAYALARRGEPVTLAPREVVISALELVSYKWPHASLRIVCSKGTYIRSLAHDIGATLGCGGLMDSLARTRVGEVRLADCVALDALTPDNWREFLIPPRRLLTHLPELVVSPDEVRKIQLGQRIVRPAGVTAEGVLLLIDSQGALVALGTYDAQTAQVQPTCVFTASKA